MALNKMHRLQVKGSYSPQSGFTLIELLIAMAVSAVVAVLSYQSIASMVQVEQRVTEHQQDMQTLQRAIWWMEQDAIQVAPRAINDGMNGLDSALRFSSDNVLEFSRLANFMTPHSQNGLLRVAYQLQDKVLYRLVWPVMDRVADSEPKKMPILRNVQTINWRFLDQKNQWQAIWPPLNSDPNQTTLQALPKLFEVTLVLQNGEKIQRLFRGTDGVLPDFPEKQAENTEVTQ